MSKHARWLEAESKRWVAEGIVSGEQAERIRARYQEPAGGLSWGLIVFFGLGAVIVGLGVILLFAYNWDAIPKFGKLGLIFAAMMGAHAAGLRLRRQDDWRSRLGEALSLLGTMAFGAGIWLVAQVYHIDEHFPTGFLVWSLGALAMAWALDAVTQAMLAAVLLAIWGGSEVIAFRAPVDWSAILLVVGVGPLVWRQRSALLLAVLLAALYWLLLCHAALWGGAAGAFANGFALSALLVALAKLDDSARLTDAQRATLNFYGRTGFVVCAFLLSFPAAGRGLTHWEEPELAGATLVYRWAVFALAAAAWGWLLAQVVRGRRELVQREEWLLPIGLAYAQALSVVRTDYDGILAATVFNLVCVATAAAWMVRGCRDGRLAPTVLGSVLLAVVVFARYFDLFDSLAIRGAAFVVFGGVLFAEGFYYRRLRRVEAAAGAP